MRSLTGWFMAWLLLLALGCRGPADGKSPSTGRVAEPPAPKPARIIGEVQLKGQAEAGGVQIYIPGTSYGAFTGRDGRFILDGVGPGQYEVNARVEGYQDATLGSVTVATSDKPEVYMLPSVELVRRATSTPQDEARRLGAIHGRLISEGGDTVDWSGAELELVKTPFRTTAAADGSFLFWNLPADQYQLLARVGGFETTTTAVRVLPGPDPTTVTVAMFPEAGSTPGQGYIRTYPTPGPARAAGFTSGTTATMGRLRGVAVKNQEGLDDMSGISITLAGTSLAATTARDGSYHLDNVPPGMHELLAQAQGFEPAKGEVEVAPGEDRQLDQIVLEPIRNYPEVLETNPADGTRGFAVQREMPIYVRFSKKMNGGSVHQAVSIDPPVSFKVFIGKDLPDTDFDLMKVVINGAASQPPIHFRTRYTLTISEAATDVEGLTLQEPFQMSFTTGDAQVIRTIPSNGARDVGLSPQNSVVVYFNAPMNYRSLSASVLRIQPPLGTAPIVALSDDPETGWTRLQVQGIWRPDTQYRVTVQRQVRTLSNNPVSNTPYLFQFRTAKLEPIRLPTRPQTAR